MPLASIVVPNALAMPAWRTLALTLVPPSYAFLAPSVTVPLVFQAAAPPVRGGGRNLIEITVPPLSAARAFQESVPTSSPESCSCHQSKLLTPVKVRPPHRLDSHRARIGAIGRLVEHHQPLLAMF